MYFLFGRTIASRLRVFVGRGFVGAGGVGLVGCGCGFIVVVFVVVVVVVGYGLIESLGVFVATLFFCAFFTNVFLCCAILMGRRNRYLLRAFYM